MKVIYFLGGLCFGFVVLGCTAMTFNYQYYGLQSANYDGKLLAVDPKDDKDLAMCAPDSAATGKCIVMLGADFYALKQDYMDCQQKLITCQKGQCSR